MEKGNIIYKIVDKSKKEKKGLEGIVEKKSMQEKPYRYIEISKWNNWHSSFWIKFVSGKDKIIVDSGVILELARLLPTLKNRVSDEAV